MVRFSILVYHRSELMSQSDRRIYLMVMSFSGFWSVQSSVLYQRSFVMSIAALVS